MVCGCFGDGLLVPHASGVHWAIIPYIVGFLNSLNDFDDGAGGRQHPFLPSLALKLAEFGRLFMQKLLNVPISNEASWQRNILLIEEMDSTLRDPN